MFSWPSLHERMCWTWGWNSGPLACQVNSLLIELPRPANTQKSGHKGKINLFITVTYTLPVFILTVNFIAGLFVGVFLVGVFVGVLVGVFLGVDAGLDDTELLLLPSDDAGFSFNLPRVTVFLHKTKCCFTSTQQLGDTGDETWTEEILFNKKVNIKPKSVILATMAIYKGNSKWQRGFIPRNGS